ncbi:MAG: mechanosensitive ion channel [Clostridiales bacterium]|jgi:small conductance mechanosensitive channel|nr:mechanosensitive ion channel [Clostridiales bacterium]
MDQSAQFGRKALAFFLVLIAGIFLIKNLDRILKKVFSRRQIDGIVARFITSLLYVVLFVLLVILLFDIMQVSLAPLVTILGAVGLALSLSLKDSLSNLASGILIIATKLFKQEDHVKIGDLEGMVKQIKFFTTELYTYDNKKIILPNNVVASSEIINYSALDIRRLDIDFLAPFGTSLEIVREILYEMLSSSDLVLKDPAPAVKLLKHTSSTLFLSARMWVKTDDYWTAYFEMQEKLYNQLLKHGIEVKTDKVEVKMLEE